MRQWAAVTKAARRFRVRARTGQAMVKSMLASLHPADLGSRG